MRTLLTGARGLLAAAILREFEAAGGAVTALDRAALDVTDPAAVSRAVTSARPDVIVNCAAYNDVDGAEKDAPAALAVNALAVRHLASAALEAGATLVHYGTDFVFDGQASEPYTEEDRTNPRSVYSASKLLGEWFALEHPRAYVLRVESLFGEPGPGGSRQGSLGAILSRLKAGETVPVFVDRTVSPAYTTDVARATRAVLEKRIQPGLYHCVNGGAATWAEVAAEAARLLHVQDPRFAPLTLETVNLTAPRPKYCALSNARLARGGVTMPSWRDALVRFLQKQPDPGSVERVGGEGGQARAD